MSPTLDVSDQVLEAEKLLKADEISDRLSGVNVTAELQPSCWFDGAGIAS